MWSLGLAGLLAVLAGSPTPLAATSATARAQTPDSVTAGCESARRLAGRILGLETVLDREADVINEFAQPHAPRPGCRVSGQTDKAGAQAPVDDLAAALQAEGWNPLPAYMADGPDGSLMGLSRGSTICLVRGRWDGGDDSDPSYVPRPGYALEVTCFRRQPRDDRR